MKLCPQARAPAWLLALALMLLATGAHATVRAWLDRTSISMGETVTLNVEADGATEPDFSALETDFRIAGRSSSTQMQIINGAVARTNLWAVALEPLREGVIGIAPLAVGQGHTEPLSLTVTPTARGSAAAGDDVFLELEVDDARPYVQQRVNASVRLFYAVSILDGQLDDPAGDGLQVRRVGADVNYSRQLNGRRYNVVERHYAVAADRSGQLSLAPVTFRGRVAAGGRGSFFNQGTPLVTASGAVELDVQPAPDGASQPWIPARAVLLSDDAARLPDRARVGDALELTLRVEVTGLAAEQVPPLELPPIAGAEVYPDQETQETREVDGRLVGVRSRKFAIVPQQAGTLALPERSLSWWNLERERTQRSTLPARSIDIEAGAAPGAVPQSPDGLAAAAASAVPGETGSQPRTVVFWQRTAALLALAWLLTLVAWYWHSRAGGGAHEDRPDGSGGRSTLWRAGLAHALAHEDLAAARRALLRIRPDTVDLADLIGVLADPDQCAAAARLDRVLYRGDPAEGLVEELRLAFARAPRFLDEGDRPVVSSGARLPPLYPTGRGR